MGRIRCEKAPQIVPAWHVHPLHLADSARADILETNSKKTLEKIEWIKTNQYVPMDPLLRGCIEQMCENKTVQNQ